MKSKFLIPLAILLLVASGFLLFRDRTDRGKTSSSEKGRPSGGPLSSAEGNRPLPEDRKRQETDRHQRPVELDPMTSQWLGMASEAFAQTKADLVADLALDAGAAAGLEKVFKRREEELAFLFQEMTTDGVSGGRDLLQEICGLLRHQGLRKDLAEFFSDDQLAAFDAREERRKREEVEARVYRDLAEINSVIRLTDAQKDEVLGVLVERAPGKIEREADARAFMSLTYGPLAATMDPSQVGMLAGLMNGESLAIEGGDPIPNGSVAARSGLIEEELADLATVLDDDQLARYRDYLDSRMAR